jgi:phospholipase/lecithinase/hemolysin
MKTIKHIVVLGDSLSDEGDLDHRKLFGIIPLAALSGLDDTPIGRFTNGFTWVDDFAIKQIEAFLLEIFNEDWTPEKIAKLGFKPDGKLADLLLNTPKDPDELRTQVENALQNVAQEGDASQPLVEFINRCFSLHNFRFVRFLGEDFVRNYAEGGLTAHDWKGSVDELDSPDVGADVGAFGAREIVENLSQARQSLLQFDQQNGVTQQQKNESLVFEWSGANDLITVNTEPSIEAADKAVAARVNNLKKLIEAGYRNFVLIDMPNLKLTPRFQQKLLDAQKTGDVDTIAAAEQELKDVQDVCLHFNQQLRDQVQALQSQLLTESPELADSLKVDIFDGYSAFQEIYDNAESEGFTELTTPYQDSDEYDADAIDPANSDKYLFWNDVHPSAHMHKLLADRAQAFIADKYTISSPSKLNFETLALQGFLQKYEIKLAAERGGFFGFLRRSKLDREHTNLSDLFYHGLAAGKDRSLFSFLGLFKHKGDRTLSILREMGWVDTNGNLSSDFKDNPVMQQAYQSAMQKIAVDDFKKAYSGWFNSYKFESNDLPDAMSLALVDGDKRALKILDDMGYISIDSETNQPAPSAAYMKLMADTQPTPPINKNKILDSLGGKRDDDLDLDISEELDRQPTPPQQQTDKQAANESHVEATAEDKVSYSPKSPR